MNNKFTEIFEHVRPSWPQQITVRTGRGPNGERRGFNYDAYIDAVEDNYQSRSDSKFLGECMNWAIFSSLPRDTDATLGIDDVDQEKVKRLFDENIRSYIADEFLEEPEYERDMEAYEYVQSLDR